mgnify:FL=1
MVVIACIGGIAKYLQGYLKGRKFSLAHLLASCFVSGFSGFIFALFGKAMNLPADYLYVTAGVGGFMGSSAIDLVAESIKRKLEVNPEPKDSGS